MTSQCGRKHRIQLPVSRDVLQRIRIDRFRTLCATPSSMSIGVLHCGLSGRRCAMIGHVASVRRSLRIKERYAVVRIEVSIADNVLIVHCDVGIPGLESGKLFASDVLHMDRSGDLCGFGVLAKLIDTAEPVERVIQSGSSRIVRDRLVKADIAHSRIVLHIFQEFQHVDDRRDVFDAHRGQFTDIVDGQVFQFLRVDQCQVAGLGNVEHTDCRATRKADGRRLGPFQIDLVNHRCGRQVNGLREFRTAAKIQHLKERLVAKGQVDQILVFIGRIRTAQDNSAQHRRPGKVRTAYMELGQVADIQQQIRRAQIRFGIADGFQINRERGRRIGIDSLLRLPGTDLYIQEERYDRSQREGAEREESKFDVLAQCVTNIKLGILKAEPVLVPPGMNGILCASQHGQERVVVTLRIRLHVLHVRVGIEDSFAPDGLRVPEVLHDVRKGKTVGSHGGHD